jgi:hypothetical protein
MLIPHGTERSQILEVTSSWLRLGAVGLAVILGIAVLTGYTIAYRAARTGFDEGLLTAEITWLTNWAASTPASAP